MRRLAIFVLIVAAICFVLLPMFALVQAQEPTPAPAVIAAPKEATGTGKRADPFTFDQSTKCVLRLQGASADVVWDLEDCPPDAEAIGPVVVFSLSEPGDYVAWASWTGGKAKAWFRIKGPNGPPAPVNQIVTKLKSALIGPDAKADAAKLAGMAGATADAIDSGNIKTVGELGTAWKTAQQASQWPANKYPAMPEIMRLVMPPTDITTSNPPLDPSVVQNLRLVEKTARAISNG